jgi:hypothetical protein
MNVGVFNDYFNYKKKKPTFIQLFEITEVDLMQMQVKRGHRRVCSYIYYEYEYCVLMPA